MDETLPFQLGELQNPVMYVAVAMVISCVAMVTISSDPHYQAPEVLAAGPHTTAPTGPKVRWRDRISESGGGL